MPSITWEKKIGEKLQNSIEKHRKTKVVKFNENKKYSRKMRYNFSDQKSI